MRRGFLFANPRYLQKRTEKTQQCNPPYRAKVPTLLIYNSSKEQNMVTVGTTLAALATGGIAPALVVAGLFAALHYHNRLVA